MIKDFKKIRSRLYSWEANRHYVKDNEIAQIQLVPEYQCDLCAKSPFQNPGMLALHKIQQHDSHPESYYYIDTTWCPICMNDYGSIIRVREHLRQTEHPENEQHISCIEILRHTHVRMTNEQQQIADAIVKMHKKEQKKRQVNERKAISISRRVPGPFPKSIMNYQQERLSALHLDSLLQGHDDALYSPDDPEFHERLDYILQAQSDHMYHDQLVPNPAPQHEQHDHVQSNLGISDQGHDNRLYSPDDPEFQQKLNDIIQAQAEQMYHAEMIRTQESSQDNTFPQTHASSSSSAQFIALTPPQYTERYELNSNSHIEDE